MNVEFLPVLIVEELRTLFDADSQLSETLPEMERASLSPQVRKAINRRRELEQTQSRSLVQILARFEALPGGGQCHAMRGLLGEAEEVLRRESGMYPARLEPGCSACCARPDTCEWLLSKTSSRSRISSKPTKLK